MSHNIDFYFDFWSPYGYLASQRIDALAARHGRSVNWRPFMLGAAFTQTNMQPLLNIPMIGPYSEHDFRRCAREQKVPFQMPPDFPKAALAPSRAYYWIYDQNPDQANAFARAIYKVTFGEGRDTTDPQLTAQIAAEQGCDADALLAAIVQPEVKERLKTVTTEALSRGVFGSPFIFVDDEPFFGNDRIDQIDRWLETGGW
jgi:2-hydroxychromene-2-carboxylate isomerase